MGKRILAPLQTVLVCDAALRGFSVDVRRSIQKLRHARATGELTAGEANRRRRAIREIAEGLAGSRVAAGELQRFPRQGEGEGLEGTHGRDRCTPAASEAESNAARSIGTRVEPKPGTQGKASGVQGPAMRLLVAREVSVAEAESRDRERNQTAVQQREAA